MILRIFLFILLSVCVLPGFAQNREGEESLSLSQDTLPQKTGFIKRFINAFNETDTNYIEPNHYNWAFMLQNTNTFESYTIKDIQSGQSITLSPKPSVRIGPYMGWRWIFFGYTFDVNSLFKGHTSTKTEFELSLYSSMLGCDLIYRRTGDDFNLSRMKGFSNEVVSAYEGKSFNGIRCNTTGINAYYIFNHKRFSYPAAFAQSTVQKRSCGTWKAGFSFTMHELEFDYTKLPDEIPVSQQLKFQENKYWNLSLSVGYGYNWVFKKNCLLNVTLTPSVGYAQNNGNLRDKVQSDETLIFRHFNRNNLNFNCTGRLGVVWNNTKYFAGMSLIVHSFNYKHSQLFTNNTFGTLNFYVGLNFMKRKAYRDQE